MNPPLICAITPLRFYDVQFKDNLSDVVKGCQRMLMKTYEVWILIRDTIRCAMDTAVRENFKRMSHGYS